MKWNAWVGIIVAPALTILFIWLPFGFELCGLVEEWIILDLFRTHGIFFFATHSSPLPHHSLRPLTILPHAIAYWMDSNSFFWWHILTIFGLTLKGCSLAFIGSKLTNSLSWGMFLGVISIIYPADTMQICFRSIHINIALGLLLFAAALTMIANDQENYCLKFFFCSLSVFFFLCSVLMYEAGVCLFIIPALLTYIASGNWKNVIKSPMPLLCWAIASFFYIAYACFIVFIIKSPTYQEGIAQDSSKLALFFRGVPKLFTVTLPRALFGGWRDGINIAFTEFNCPIYVLIIVSLMCAIILISRKITISPNSITNEAISSFRGKRLIISGVILILAGYLPYFVSPYFWATCQRTYLFATPGASLVVLGVVTLIRLRSILFSGMSVAIFMIAGFSAQLFQFHYYLLISNSQKVVLKTIVENFNGNLDQKSLVIFDESLQFNSIWTLHDNLHQALCYFYDKPITPIQICTFPYMEWKNIGGYSAGACRIVDESLVFRDSPNFNPDVDPATYKPAIVIPQKNAIVLNILKDGSIETKTKLDNYQNKLQISNTAQAQRYKKMLLEVLPVLPLARFQLFKGREPTDYYRWDFGKWWGMEPEFRGSGWSNTLWKGIFNKTVVWKNQTDANLLFEFKPEACNYKIKGSVYQFYNDEIKKSVTIHVNNTKVEFEFNKDGNFEGRIRSDAFVGGVNTIKFTSKIFKDFSNTSFALDWLEISPDKTH